jgi:hypothetical protein
LKINEIKIGAKDIENLIVIRVLEKIINKDKSKKRPFHASLLGILGWNLVGRNTIEIYSCST